MDENVGDESLTAANSAESGDGFDDEVWSAELCPLEPGGGENKLCRRSFCAVLLPGTAEAASCRLPSCRRAKCLPLMCSSWASL